MGSINEDGPFFDLINNIIYSNLGILSYLGIPPRYPDVLPPSGHMPGNYGIPTPGNPTLPMPPRPAPPQPIPFPIPKPVIEIPVRPEGPIDRPNFPPLKKIIYVLFSLIPLIICGVLLLCFDLNSLINFSPINFELSSHLRFIINFITIKFKLPPDLSFL